MSEKLAANLCARVGTDRLKNVIVLPPRNIWIDPINTRRTCKYELRSFPFPCQFEEILRAADVDFLVSDRILDRRPHSRPSCKMNDAVIAAGEICLHCFKIADIDPVEFVIRILPVRGDISFLDRRIVKRIEIVDHRHVVSIGQKAIDQMTADKAGSSCDEKRKGFVGICFQNLNFLDSEQADSSGTKKDYVS